MGTLSVIIPVYRVESTLNRCLESVTRQTYRDLDIILVDDGSSDRCPALCDEWAERDRRIRVIHKKNGGLSSARNAGLAEVKGEWVTFVDSDDYIDDTTYEAVSRFLGETLDSDRIDMVEFPVEYGGKRMKDPVATGISRLNGRVGEYWLTHRQWERCAVWCKVFRRTLFDGLRFPDGEYHEDIYLLPSLMLRMRLVATIPYGLYHYTPNPEGICSTPSVDSMTLAIRNHLRAARILGIELDDAWYMALVNMHITLWRIGGKEVLLPSRRVNPFRLTGWRVMVKAVVLDFIGLRNLLCLWR